MYGPLPPRSVRMALVLLGALVTATASVAQPSLRFEPLPELPGAASSAYDAQRVPPADGMEGGQIVVCGQSLDDDGVAKAVLWSRCDVCIDWQLLTLPNPFGNTESAATSCSGAGSPVAGSVLRAAGHALDLAGNSQPVDWYLDEGALWTADVPPLPTPYDIGGIQFMDKAQLVELILKDRKAGFSSSSDGTEPNHAVSWQRDVDGIWMSELLPDYGPGFASEALAIVSDPITGLRSIGGYAQPDVGAGSLPAVWEEGPADLFTRFDLPLPAGAYTGAIAALLPGLVPIEEHAVGFAGSLAALADLHRGVLFRRVAGVWGEPLELPPLPGLRDSRAVGVTLDTFGNTRVVGNSYTELAPNSEQGTLWEIAPGDASTSWPVADLITEAPFSPARIVVHATAHEAPNGMSIAADFEGAAGPEAAGILHACVLTSAAPAVPGVSSWGLAVVASALLGVAAFACSHPRSGDDERAAER